MPVVLRHRSEWPFTTLAHQAAPVRSHARCRMRPTVAVDRAPLAPNVQAGSVRLSSIADRMVQRTAAARDLAERAALLQTPPLRSLAPERPARASAGKHTRISSLPFQDPHCLEGAEPVQRMQRLALVARHGVVRLRCRLLATDDGAMPRTGSNQCEAGGQRKPMNTMEAWLKTMKQELCHVHVNNGEALWATLSDDYGACVLKDIPHEEQEELLKGEDGESRVNVCSFQRGMFPAIQGAMVTGPFSRPSGVTGFMLDMVGAPIHYTLHIRNGNIPLTKGAVDQLVVKEVRVTTSVVGRQPRGFEFDYRDIERLKGGESVNFSIDLPLVEYEGWKNSMTWSIGSGASERSGVQIKDHMTTTIPLSPARGHETIMQARERVRALMVGLGILNAAYDVRLDNVELVVDGYDHPQTLTFRHDPVKLIRYVPRGSYLQPSLQVQSRGCLDSPDGLRWISRFVDWWLDPKNSEVVWLLGARDAASSFSVMEGLVRVAWGVSPNPKESYSAKVLNVAFRKLGLPIKGGVRDAMAAAHNHRKHVFMYEGRELVMTEFGELADIVMAFVVVYTIIVLADGKHPSLQESVREQWKEEIMQMCERYLAPGVSAGLPQRIEPARS